MWFAPDESASQNFAHEFKGGERYGLKYEVFIIFVVLTVVIGVNHTHGKNQKSFFENTNESLANFHGNISLMWTARGENFFYCNF